MKNEIRKLKEANETSLKKQDSEFDQERRQYQALINQHVTTIEDLMNIKNDLSLELKRLQQILKKKEALEKQRRQLLRTEIK